MNDLIYFLHIINLANQVNDGFQTVRIEVFARRFASKGIRFEKDILNKRVSLLTWLARMRARATNTNARLQMCEGPSVFSESADLRKQ